MSYSTQKPITLKAIDASLENVSITDNAVSGVYIDASGRYNLSGSLLGFSSTSNIGDVKDINGKLINVGASILLLRFSIAGIHQTDPTKKIAGTINFRPSIDTPSSTNATLSSPFSPLFSFVILKTASTTFYQALDVIIYDKNNLLMQSDAMYWQSVG